jgi:hypothetical protein
MEGAEVSRLCISTCEARPILSCARSSARFAGTTDQFCGSPGSVDVLRPSLRHQTISERPMFVAPFGDAGVEEGRNLADGAPLNLAVLPEFGGQAVSQSWWWRRSKGSGPLS